MESDKKHQWHAATGGQAKFGIQRHEHHKFTRYLADLISRDKFSPDHISSSARYEVVAPSDASAPAGMSVEP